jgi:hypothetical protein
MIFRRSRNAARSAKNRSGDSDDAKPFTKTCIPQPQDIPSLLKPLPDLAVYAPRFTEEQIDVALASGMTMQDLRVLLPDAPLGHCLRLHALLAALSEREADIPEHPVWRTPAKMISAGVLEQSAREFLTTILEFTIIAASLCLSISFPTMMTVPAACADGGTCVTLRDADFIMWMLSTALFLFSIGTCWIEQFGMSCMLEGEIAQHQAAHFGMTVTPTVTFITGVALFTAGIATRCMISLESAVLAKAAAATFSLVLATTWAYFWATAMQFGGLKFSELLWNQLGFFGLYLPQRLREKKGGTSCVLVKPLGPFTKV